jgi:hypothetical protein
MALYEMVREIKNQCPNNQMRDVFFEEVETADPVEYVKNTYRGSVTQLTADRCADGSVTVHAVVDSLTQIFRFTPID